MVLFMKLDNDKVYVIFLIEDIGVGIFEMEIDKIFVMYYQVDYLDYQFVIGIGIGLVICK